MQMNKEDFKVVLVEALKKMKFVDYDFTPGLYRLDMVVKLNDDGSLKLEESYLGKGHFKDA